MSNYELCVIGFYCLACLIIGIIIGAGFAVGASSWYDGAAEDPDYWEDDYYAARSGGFSRSDTQQ